MDTIKTLGTLALIGLMFNPYKWCLDRVWNTTTDAQRMNLSCEYKANAVGLTEEEFIQFAKVVEAESDRSSDLESKVLIAEVIWNRYYSNSWPNTIEGVIYQSGQFEVTWNGMMNSVDVQSVSEWAIVEAHRRIAENNAPNVMYFNCVGYGYGTPYCESGGNYFTVV